MTALATLDLYAQRDIAFFGGNRFVSKRSLSVYTAGAAYIELTFGLRVKIEQVFALQPTAFEVIRSVHTRFFIDGEERLQRRMNDILIRQYSHRCRYANTVVRAECGAVSGYPLAVVLDIGLNRVFLKIKHFVAVLLRHHIHVALQNNTRMVLHTGTGRLTNKHIAYLVLKGFQTERLAVVHEELSYLFAFSAGTRNLSKAVETAPQTFGFKIFHNNMVFSLLSIVYCPLSVSEAV